MSQPLIMEHVATSSRSKLDNRCTMDYTSQFTATPTFKSKEELIKWAKEVGRSNNITVVVLRSDSGNGKKKPKVTLGCERSGKCDIRNTGENRMMGKSDRRHTGTKKSDCPFRLTGKMVAAGDEWQLIVVEGKHNHEAEDTTGKQGHSFHGRLSQEEKSLVKDMYERGKQPMEILRELKKRDKHNKSTPRTIYNACQRLKHVEGLKRLDSLEDTSSGLQLMSQAKEYGFIIKKHKTSPKMETASDLLLTHPTSLELLLSFPTVLIIERIEWVMRPRWAVCEVYGVTSTDVIFLVASACISGHGGSYEWDWPLTSLRGLMIDYRITMPDIVVHKLSAHKFGPHKTELHPMEEFSAINNVFRRAKLMLSRDTIFDFVQPYTLAISELNVVERNSFMKKWELLVASPTEAVLEQRIMQLRTEFEMYPGALEYAIDTLLKPYKEMLVAAWTDKVMHFGITNLDLWNQSNTGYLMLRYLYDLDGADVDQTVIDDFWEKFHGWIEYDNVKASLKESLENEYNDQYGFPELKKLHGTISIHALTLIRKETIVAREIDDDYGETCSCAIRSTHGLPCAHDIAKYIREGQPIPLECINSYWRKLDLKPFSKTAEPIVEGRFKRRRLSEEKTTATDSVQALLDIVESELNSPNAGPSIVPSTQARPDDDSARRSRMRKQQHLDELTAQVTQLRKENSQIVSSINVTTQHYMNVEAENSVLKAQMAELSQRLESLTEILNYINGNNNNNGVLETEPAGQQQMLQTGSTAADHNSFMINPWNNLLYSNLPIMATADMLQY